MTNDIGNYLQQYLRNNADVSTADEMLKPLIQVAIAFDKRNGTIRSDETYDDICTDAIETFKKHWENKKPGEDDRGHRNGETYESWKNISNVLQGMI